MKKIAVVLTLAVAFCFALMAFNSNNVLATPATLETQIAIGNILVGNRAYKNLMDGVFQIKQNSSGTPYIYGSSTTFPIVIDEPGSYLLTSDIVVTTSVNAIQIQADNVTLDLNGFSIIGSDSVSSKGIDMYRQSNVEIRNGTVRDFATGIWERGSSEPFGRAHRVINVRVVSNNVGMSILGYGHLIKDCSASENTLIGIYAYQGCTVTGNTAYDNADDGIRVAIGSTVLGNTAHDNGGNGISTGNRCTVTENTAYLNVTLAGIKTGTGCTVTNNTVSDNNVGIDAGEGSTVNGNTAIFNTGDGIKVDRNSRVVNNMCSNNGYQTGDGAGIHATGSANHIEGNTVSVNDRGIDVDGINNIIVKNSARSNLPDYDIVTGNKTGTISTDPTTAGPWDNFHL